MYFDFANALIFIVVAMTFILASLLIGRLLRPSDPHSKKLETYECGEEAVGSAWVQFNVRFYIIALVFLIFDVEIAVLYPWAVIFGKIGLLGFLEMLTFVGILTVGFVYVWVKGDLEWLKSLGEIKENQNPNIKNQN